jgi:ABC-2 type transport system ATP-binding protein
VLEVRNLRKSFGQVQAVQDLSFTVAKGERFGLLGPNGAGKTTAISMITGTLDSDEGEVYVGGERVTVNSLEAKRKIGYVPQELALYDEISAVDNLRFFGSLYGLTSVQIGRASEKALTMAGLTDRANDLVKTYSGGMKRRLNIAVALMHDPELLIFDEPTVGVDPQSRNQIFETLLILAEGGKTIIYTTHYMEEVERLCQRVAVVDHGKLVAQGTMSELHRLLPQSNLVQMELTSAPVDISWPKLASLAVEGPNISFESQNLTKDLLTLTTLFDPLKIEIKSVRSQSPSLEEVFLHLTGRSLRD